MNFSAISNKNLVGRLLRFPLNFIPREARLPILQGRLKGKRWIAGSGNHGCWLGSYEYSKRRAFERMVNEGAVVFDIGAHVGFYTLLGAVLVGPRGKVFAFEPLPRNVRYLKEHLRLNAIKNVSVIEAAVSDSDGIAFFAEGQNNSTGQLAPAGLLRVKTVSLDEITSAGPTPPPDFLKIDVEGGEMLVLKGARCVLVSHHPTIFLATHGDVRHRECCKFLRSLGYELRSIGSKLLEETDELLAYRKR